jgi:predicted phage-related endonuclease
MTYASRREWLALRQDDLTASEAGALWGVHKYTTRRRIAMQKLYGENDEQSAIMRRGKIMEPAVAEAITVDCGWSPRRCQSYLRGRASDPLVKLGASRDYMIDDMPVSDLLAHDKTRASALAGGLEARVGEDLSLVVECKNLDPGVHAREWMDGPPVYTVVQAAQQAMLADADGALVAALLENRSRDLFLYYVPRDPGFELRLIEEVRDFWRNFSAGDMPPVEAGDNDFMRDYYPTSRDEDAVDLTDEAAVWTPLAEERERRKMQQKIEQRRIDEIEATLKDQLGAAARGTLPGWSLTWKSNAKGVRSFSLDRALPKTPRTKR